MRAVHPLNLPVMLALVGALWAIPVSAAPADGSGYVIPKGSDKRFLKMTNPGRRGFPGGWKLEGVQIRVGSAVATYTGRGGKKIGVELTHPAVSATPLAVTEQFALVAAPGSKAPPAKFLKALERLIEKYEKGFRWVRQVRSAAVPPDRLNRARYRLNAKQRKLLGQTRELARAGEKGPASKLALGLAKRAKHPDPARAAAEVLRAHGLPGEAARVLGANLGRLGLERDPSAHKARLERLASMDQAGSKKSAAVAEEIAGDFPRLYPVAACARVAGLQVLLREGRIKVADRVASSLVGDTPIRCVALFRLKVAMAAGEDGPVDGAATKVLEAFPDDRDALFLWGTHYYKKGREKQALLRAAEIWDRLAAVNPRYPTFIGQYGTVYLVGGRLGAEATLKLKARALAKPDDMVAAYLAGIGLYYQRRYREVIPFLKRAADAVPDDPRAHMYLAMAHFFDGDRKLAARMLEALDHHAYQEPDIYYCRSLFYRDHDLPRAIREMEKFLEVFEGENRLRFGQEKVDKARDDLERMRKGEVPDVHLAIPDPLPEGQPYPARGPVDTDKREP